MYTQPQYSMHPSLVNHTKYHVMFMGTFVASTLLQLSLTYHLTTLPSYTSEGTGTESFQDAEVSAKAFEAFNDGKGVWSDWPVAAKSGGYVAFTLIGINYAYPAFVDVPESVMPAKSAKILLGYDDATFHAGWLQSSRVLSTSRSAAAVQHAANLVLGDFATSTALKAVAQRALDFAAKVREIPGYDQSIEGLVVSRAGLTMS